MARYFRGHIKASFEYDWSDGSNQPDTVYVDDHEAVDTGLLFEDGSPVMRAPNPIGFLRDDEW